MALPTAYLTTTKNVEPILTAIKSAEAERVGMSVRDWIKQVGA